MAIPFKVFEQICDLQIKYSKTLTREDQNAVGTKQDQYGWPWSLSAEQRQDWEDLGKRLEPHVIEAKRR